MAEFLVHRPESPIRETFSFSTDIMQASDGTEARTQVRYRPRMTWTYRFLLDSEAELRRWKVRLFQRGAEFMWLPLWHEIVRTDAESASGQNQVNGDFGKSDYFFGDDEFIIMKSDDEDTWEFHDVGGRVAGGITTEFANLSNTYPAGSLVIPVTPVHLDDKSGFARHVLNAGDGSMTFTDERQRVLRGLGGSTTTHNGKVVLDRRPLAQSKVAEDFHQGSNRVDFGQAFKVHTDWAEAKIAQRRQVLLRGVDDRQWLRRFLDSVDGRRTAFYAPTWRPDLVVDTQPSDGSSTLVVEDEPDYKLDWHVSDAHKHLQLETSDGILHREVSSVVDNGDGTQTLTLATAFGTPAPTVDVVSFLELVRLESDDVQVTWHRADLAFADLDVVTVQA